MSGYLIEAGADKGRGLRPVAAALGLAAALALAGCAGPFAYEGVRAPDVHYDPTPPNVVEDMVRLAAPREGEVVYDMGCGDGRLVIAAVRRGARGVCVDIDPRRIREARANAAAAGVAERIRFVEGDLFVTDFRDAHVMFLFLWPDLNLKLRPRLHAELRPGTRVVSYVHDMGDWAPETTLRVRGNHGERNVYLWRIGPAR